MADIESLELQITGDASKAKAGLDALIGTLDTLKGKIKGGVGLTSVANQVRKMADAAGKMNGSEGAKLESLAKGLQALSGLGNLKLSSSIANQISAMGTAVKNLDGADFTKVKDLATGLAPLETLGKSNLSSVLNQIKKLPDVMAELNKVDMGAFKAKIQELTASLKPLADEMQKVANGFSAFPGKIQQLLNSSSKLPSGNVSTGKSFTNLAARVTAMIYTFKRAAGVIASWINESNEYTENMNLFTVSMGEYTKSAMEYANTVSDVMGIDTSDWIRNQGVFMTLSTGFGVATDRAATMSQQLTQLGYDISSFYNKSVEDAMQRLQSGLAGELEPLRRLGYDLSQAKLEATALSLGIDKAVSSMTQAEKAELRYYAIMTQVTQVQGDMARTLQDPANQLRIFRAQLQMAARALGNIFIPALNAILPYAIAAVKVVRLLADAIAGLFGYEFTEVGESSIGGLGDSASDASDSIDDATSSAKALRKTLLGIDELNVMSDTSATGGADVSGGGSFDFELPTYDFISEAANNRVNEIVESMKEWLGITGEITSWSDLMDTRFGSILKTAGLIGVAIGSWKIGVGIAGIVNFFKNSAFISSITTAMASGASFWQALVGAFSGAAGIIGGVTTAIVGLVTYVSNLVSMLRDGEDASNVLGAALGGLATAAGGFLIALGVGATVATGGIVAAVIAAVAAVGMLVAVIVNHWEEIKAAIGTAWTWFYDNVLAPIGAWFAGAATWFYNNVITPIVNFFAPIVTAVIDIAVLIYTRVKEIVTGIIVAIGSIFTKAWEIFSKIVEIVVALGKAFFTYVITPVANALGAAATWVYNTLIKPVINFFITLGNLAYTYIIKPIFDGVVWLKDQAVALFKKIGTTIVNFVSNLLKSVINGVLSGIENKINLFIRLLNGAIDLINKIPGVNISKVTTISIPRLADGGAVNTGQMFIAREAGPELVGTIGDRSAVVNNDQIVESVSRGVYQAVVSAMGQSGGNQVVEAKVNDKVLFEVVVNRNRQETMRTGYSPLLGGV